MALHSREIRLVRRPSGYPIMEDMALVEADLAEPREGEVVVRNRLMSVDPYMRGRMNDVKSYVPPFRLDEAMEGQAIGTVVESRSAHVPVGATVRHMLGWRDFAVLSGKAVEVIDTAIAPEEAYLGILGTTGFTAWVGLFQIANLKPGEVVFISAASGAVGSAAGQLAKSRGAARVVGSTGSDAKAEYLRTTLGFDDAFTYNSGDVGAKLRAAAPDGIDVYFDNVGGAQLEAALGALKPFGRVAECGMISQYNEPKPGPRNLPLIVGKRLRLQGFIVLDHQKSYPTFLAEVAPALRDGRITDVQTLVDGLENAPQTLIDMLHGGGKHVGKVLVRIAQRGAPS